MYWLKSFSFYHSIMTARLCYSQTQNWSCFVYAYTKFNPGISDEFIFLYQIVLKIVNRKTYKNNLVKWTVLLIIYTLKRYSLNELLLVFFYIAKVDNLVQLL